MIVRRREQDQDFDLSMAGYRWAVPTLGASSVRVSSTPLATSTTGIATIYASSDGWTLGASLDTVGPGNDATNTLDISTAFIIVRTTTVESAIRSRMVADFGEVRYTP